MPSHWLTLLACLFLAPGAIGLGAMGIVVLAGAADVVTRRHPPAARSAAVFVMTSLAALAWSALIVWIASFARDQATTPAAVMAILAAVTAAAPPVLFLAEISRSGDTGIGMIAAVALATVTNGGFVLAMFV